MNGDIIYEYSKPDRLVVIGDIHGDIKRFKNILIDAKIINNNIEWIAEPKNTIVIQMGDQIDSLNRIDKDEWEIIEDIEMLRFTDLLEKIANTKGGKFISIIGNHEYMNILGNYTYVSKKSIGNNENRRRELFKPSGQLSKILSNRPIIVKIGSLLFCHAGLKLSHLFILHKYKKDVSHINKIWKSYVTTSDISNNDDKEIFSKIIFDDDGILWTRNLNTEEELNIMLNRLKCNYMFIGHNVVENIRLVNNNIWYTDTGISRAFGNKDYQYIDILDNNFSIKTLNN